MKPILALCVSFCLVSNVLTKPIPEGNEEATGENATEEPKNEKTTGAAIAEDNQGEENKKEGEDDSGQPDINQDESEGDTTTEGGDNIAKNGDMNTNANGDGKESSPTDNEKSETKNDPEETYNKVIGLLDQIKLDNVENGYERSELTADLQRYLRNPIVDVIGTVGDFSKISDCFKSLADDTKKAIEEDLKAFKECTAKNDSDAYQCSQNRSSVQDRISKISAAIKVCVASNRS
ncbi:30 kDa salivary gland allergen Aed a 3-like [Armigeres subalbatus]|uniref:30 kDa salivary gland allergen Aed a 3-like n=1 Tax=Armigeres subalbatus TaxID=124917 RepID=UPI002ED55ADA